jgi:integrase
VYAKTKTALLLKMTAVKVDAHGGAPRDRRLTFGKLAELWVANRKAKLKFGTWKAYERTLKKHGAALWRRPLVAIEPLDLDANLRDLALAGVPSAARAAYRERLRQLFKYAVAKRLLPVSPAAALEQQPHEPAARVTWERTHAAAFLGAARETRLYPLFYLALATGLRAGELLALQWPDLDLDAGTLTVRHTWGPGENGHALGKPKTKAGTREIPLSPDTVAVLAAWREAWLSERVYEVGADDVPDLDLVFSWPTGRPMSASTLSRVLDEIITTAKVPRLTMHGLRHVYATLALQAGVPVQVLSERLGHSDTITTMNVYIDVLKEQREAAALSMDRLLSEPEATRKLHSATTKQVQPN